MSAGDRESEQGFLLLGLIVAIFLILLALTVAAPKMARALRREREVETVRRGNQYVRAIQLYYRKFGHYPGSMDQLEKTNNIRFLRQDYVDPMTGKADWRIIKVGENKTTVKGFFGKPLAGLPGAGIGSAGGGSSSFGATGSPATGSAFGNTGGLGSSQGSSGFSMGGGSAFGSTSSSFSSGGLGSSSPTGSSGTGSPTSSSGGISNTSASSFTGSQGPVMGVGLVREGESVITLNEQTTYQTWEFIYDPRIEQLKARGALMGGTGLGAGGGTGGSTPATGFGSGTNSPSGSNGMGFGSSSPSSGGTGSSTPGTNNNPQ